jgi:hypothetical protein
MCISRNKRGEQGGGGKEKGKERKKKKKKFCEKNQAQGNGRTIRAS